MGAKLSILDIKAKDTRGQYYNIEVQLCNDGDYDKRALYCWGKLYTDQLGVSAKYRELRKAIGIHVLNFLSIPNAPNYVNRFIITNEETGLRYFKDLELYTIELCKFSDQAEETMSQLLPRIQNGLDRWAAFLTRARSIDLRHLPKELDDPCIKKAFDVLTHASLNKEEHNLYEEHLKWLMTEAGALAWAEEKGREKGLEEGVAKGRKEEKYRLVVDMITDNEPEQKIIKYSGLSSDEIAKIRESLAKVSKDRFDK